MDAAAVTDGEVTESPELCAASALSPVAHDDSGVVYYAISDFKADESDQVRLLSS